MQKMRNGNAQQNNIYDNFKSKNTKNVHRTIYDSLQDQASLGLH